MLTKERLDDDKKKSRHSIILTFFSRIKLIAGLFYNMDGKTTTTWDITLFLNVINGAFILHCEDFAMLRFCLATYISTAKHFRHIFATNGFVFTSYYSMLLHEFPFYLVVIF